MSAQVHTRVPDEPAMIDFGRSLAGRLRRGGVVYLVGDLGAGKTTLARGILRGLGHAGRVKSPTYGLLESYDCDGLTVHHLDLYRLEGAADLVDLGLEDLLDPGSLLLVEWPERGAGGLPAATLTVTLRDAHPGREVTMEPGTNASG